MVKIKKTELSGLINYLSEKYQVFAPVKDGKKTSFQKIKSADEIIDSIPNTNLSPKSIFFPQAEVLFKYDENGIKVPKKDEKPFAVWGMRNCDAKSVLMLNKVFGNAHQIPDNKMYNDPYWKQKYDSSLIFGLACNAPLSTCFCNWFDGGPFDEKGSDVFVIETDDHFIMNGISEKGKKFLKEYKKDDKSDIDKEKIESLKQKAESYLSEKVDISNIYDKLNKIWDEPIWEEISSKCINCGACTFVCSTCHCFDVSDEGKSGKGQRIRLWDSCMFPIFTNEASGHNPRGVSVQRVKQRVMHKYNYFMDNYNEHLCTGCGRCVLVCPVNLDIREILKKIIKV
ncbi:MAG: 4Fe-4S dicluster domain-containing protein [Candidatus Cloacimonetes bacterium]|nr:4Fe-4S dicluster domain-containing protein [Candidatus Cloacimonadota bacterium]